MSDENRVKLEFLAKPGKNSLATGPFGSSIGSRFFRESGVPVIRGSNLSLSVGVRLMDGEIVFVDEEKAAEFPRSVARRGDLVFTCWGTIGQVGLIDERSRFDRYIVSNKQMKMTPDSEKVDSLFLYYALSSPDCVAQVQGASIGSSVPGFNLTQLRQVEVPFLELSEQRAVASVLGALDDKIAINERIVAVADELSGDIFRHAVLERPERFTERALTDVAEFINGRAFTKDATGTGRMVIRIAEINSGPGNSTVYNDIEVPEKYLARPGDVLFAWSGSLTVARWFRSEAIVNQHIFKCVPKNGVPCWLVNQLVHRKIEEFRAIAASKATTMGHIQRKHLEEPVSIPESEEMVLLDSRIGPLWDRALLAERECLDLATLRDTLLPQLMSGRLRVKDAEKIVEDAT